MTQVHPTAIISPEAELHPDVEIGPWVQVGPACTLEAGCQILAHSVLERRVHLDEGARVGPYAVVGTAPQIRGEPFLEGGVRVGKRTVIREFTTINAGSPRDTGWTVIGDDVLVMAYSHIAHDCVLGDRVVMSNGTTLAGHVRCESDVTMGGMVAVHQYVRLGRHAFAAAGAYVERDVPPFCRVAGDRASLAGLNTVGLRRHGFAEDTRKMLSSLYRTLFRTDKPLASALLEAREHFHGEPLALELINFAESSERGLCIPRNRRQ